MTVYVLAPHQHTPHPDLPVFDVTTHGNTFRPLSPMLLGPVPLYSGMWSATMENAWQFAKLYPAHQDVDSYWPWAQAGWADTYAHRHPMGKGGPAAVLAVGRGAAGLPHRPAPDLHSALRPGGPVPRPGAAGRAEDRARPVQRHRAAGFRRLRSPLARLHVGRCDE